MGQAVTILANVGVIAGIVFLGVELRQNNEHMEAQARFNRLSIATAAWGTWADDGELSALRLRAGSGEEISELERRRVEAAIMRVFLNLEWTFRELPSGSPERNQIREVQVRNFAGDASYLAVWNDRKAAFDPDFVAWMEANVVNP